MRKGVLWSQSTGNGAYEYKYQKRYPCRFDSPALFELNIEILLADVTKPEKSNILTLT